MVYGNQLGRNEKVGPEMLERCQPLGIAATGCWPSCICTAASKTGYIAKSAYKGSYAETQRPATCPGQNTCSIHTTWTGRRRDQVVLGYMGLKAKAKGRVWPSARWFDCSACGSLPDPQKTSTISEMK
eukprot:1150624-Pelagomonas_calceolata.AAC.2